MVILIFKAAPRWRIYTHLLILEGLAQLDVVGEGPHSDGQLPDDLQIDGPSVCGGDEGVHPPVGGLGQQVDKRLQETNTEVLEVFRRLHLGRVGETHVALLTEDRTQHQWKCSWRPLLQSAVLQDTIRLLNTAEILLPTFKRFKFTWSYLLLHRQEFNKPPTTVMIVVSGGWTNAPIDSTLWWGWWKPIKMSQLNILQIVVFNNIVHLACAPPINQKLFCGVVGSETRLRVSLSLKLKYTFKQL